MTQVLQLNSSHEPLRMVPLKKAVLLIVKGRADVLEADEGAPLRYEKGVMPRPVVIKLRKYVHVPRRHRRSVSNTFLFARDNYTCAYCERTDRQLSKREGLNRDHIVPLSRGGKDEWTNVATSCSTCNSKKDNKTPAEADMTLHIVPTVPHFVHLKWAVRKVTPVQEKHIRAFFGDEWVAGVRQVRGE